HRETAAAVHDAPVLRLSGASDFFQSLAYRHLDGSARNDVIQLWSSFLPGPSTPGSPRWGWLKPAERQRSRALHYHLLSGKIKGRRAPSFASYPARWEAKEGARSPPSGDIQL